MLKFVEDFERWFHFHNWIDIVRRYREINWQNCDSTFGLTLTHSYFLLLTLTFPHLLDTVFFSTFVSSHISMYVGMVGPRSLADRARSDISRAAVILKHPSSSQRSAARVAAPGTTDLPAPAAQWYGCPQSVPCARARRRSSANIYTCSHACRVMGIRRLARRIRRGRWRRWFRRWIGLLGWRRMMRMKSM